MTLQRIDSFVQAVQQRVATEGLRPFAARTGIPIGQVRSFLEGRAVRYTTLQSMASVMGMRLFVGPAEWGGGKRPPLPEEVRRALHLPADAGIADTVAVIEKDAVAELLPRLAGELSTTRMIPFAEHIRLKADTGGEMEFEESAALSVVVAETVLPSWAGTEYLTCVRPADDSMEPTIRDGDFVVVDRDQRNAVDDQLFVVRIGDGVLVKRLRRIGDHWNLVSDNPAHQSRPMTENDRILGRVAWCPRQREASSTP